MSYRFDIRGIQVETAVPKLSQLTAFKEDPGIRANGASGSYDACKALIRGTLTSPSFLELTQKRPGCIVDLGWRILRAAGIDGGGVSELDASEIENAEMAEAYVAKSDALAKAFDPDDDRGRVIALRAVTELGDERCFIVRMPTEQEIERYRKVNTLEAAKLFVKKITQWGDVDGLEKDLPGMYGSLAEWMIDRAGEGEARRVGEA